MTNLVRQFRKDVARAERLHKAALKDLTAGFPHTAKGRIQDMALIDLYREMELAQDASSFSRVLGYRNGGILPACYKIKDAWKDGDAAQLVDEAGTVIARLRLIADHHAGLISVRHA